MPTSSFQDTRVTFFQPATTNSTNITVFFDWDDTCLASSHLSRKLKDKDGFAALKSLTEDERQSLKKHDGQLVELFNRIKSRVNLIIVTNAEKGWVELSSARYLPNFYNNFVKNKQIKIISARSTYEKKYRDAPLKWKYSAMSAHTQSQSELEHIVSFGDSNIEREAVKAVSLGIQADREIQAKEKSAISSVAVSAVQLRTKSIKFVERPGIEQLRRQILLVANCMDYILSHDGDLDLMLTISYLEAEEVENAETQPEPRRKSQP